MTFGKRLRALREEKNMSQIELSKQLKITSQALSQYELGKRMPDTFMLEKLADFFDVTIDYLLYRVNIRNPYQDKRESGFVSKVHYNLDLAGLSDEDIKQVEDYIAFLKTKYNPDGALKKNNLP
ncbi:MAG: helix-turn-helix domain-containing protein [Firmicutes bacterium]|nr:helix-turn-helix domain-containing protein [Bacillota bacterium]